MFSNIQNWLLKKCSKHTDLQRKYDNLCAQYNKTAQSVTALQQENIKLQYRRDEENGNQNDSFLTQQNQSLTQQNLELQDRINQLQQQNTELNAARITPPAETNTELVMQLQKSKDEFVKAEQKIRELENQNAAAEQQINSLNSKIVDCETKYATLQENYSRQDAKINELQNQIVELTNSNQAKDVLLTEKTNRINELNNQNDKLLADNQEKDKQLAENINTINELDKKIAELIAVNQEKDKLIDWQQKKLDSLTAERDELTQANEEWASAYKKLQTDSEETIENLENAHARALQDAQDNYLQKLGAAEIEHQKTMDAKNKEMNDLKTAHAQAMQEAQNSHLQKLETIKAEHQKAMDARKQEISTLKSEHTQALTRKDEEKQQALKQKDEEHAQIITDMETYNARLLGENIAAVFNKENINIPETRRLHLFLSLIHACDRENNYAGVQNLILLLDDNLRIEYQNSPEELAKKRRFVREIFNANIQSIEIDELPEIGKNKLEYNQSNYTVRGKGTIVTSLESICLIYKFNNTVRPGLIYCS